MKTNLGFDKALKSWEKLSKYDYIHKKTNQMIGLSKDKGKWYFVAEITDYDGHKLTMPKEFNKKQDAVKEMKEFIKRGEY